MKLRKVSERLGQSWNVLEQHGEPWDILEWIYKTECGYSKPKPFKDTTFVWTENAVSLSGLGCGGCLGIPNLDRLRIQRFDRGRVILKWSRLS